MRGMTIPTCLFASLMAVASLHAAAPGANESPYQMIAKRNLFGLVPPPPPPAAPEPEPESPSEVKLTGITTLLGIRKALLKLETPAKPPEPARSESYILVEGGPAEGGIEVVRVDVENEKVRIRRSGKEEWLPLEKDKSKPAAAPVVAAGTPGAPGNPNNPIAAALARAQAAKGAQPGIPASGLPLRNVRAGQQAGVPASGMATTTLGSSGRSRVFQATEQVGNLSPEEQIILIEANRLQTLEDQASGLVPPPPPTELTPPELDPSVPPVPQ